MIEFMFGEEREGVEGEMAVGVEEEVVDMVEFVEYDLWGVENDEGEVNVDR